MHYNAFVKGVQTKNPKNPPTCTPALFHSTSTIRRYVVFDRPLFPSPIQASNQVSQHGNALDPFLELD